MSPRIENGALYAADLNSQRGTEPGKVRPVLVVQSDLLNEVGHGSTVVLPCTTRLTGQSLLRVRLPQGMAGNIVECEIMIDQARAIDNRRLRNQLGKIPRTVLVEVRDELRRLLDR